ncbi:MAG: pseudouridine synthase [Firmicutes bacterium]|nr:pseudouridine synthase [Bacillota bacterium]
MSIRLQRYLAQAGLASRRHAEEWIKQGRVTLNGATAKIGQTVDPLRDVVTLDGKRVQAKAAAVYLVLNKPVGYTTTLKDRHAEHTVAELIPKKFGRVFPIGRLDRDTSGLLLLTNDGELAFQLMHPSFGIPRVYEAWVEGLPHQGHLDRLQRGIELPEGMSRAKSAVILARRKDQALLQLTLTEGHKREVRRLLEAVGHPVILLKRTRFGPISLKGLDEGQVRVLTAEEVKQLHSSIHPHKNVGTSRESGTLSAQPFSREKKFHAARRSPSHHG